MSAALVEAGLRLADLMAEENRLLAAMDLAAAAGLSALKQQTVQRFAAAREAAGTPLATGADSASLRRLSERLATLAADNRDLLERAIGAQARLIDLVAAALRPAAQGYAPPPSGQRATAFALNARA